MSVSFRRLVGILASLMLTGGSFLFIAEPASAATLVAAREAVICQRLTDLEALQSHLKAQDKTGAALYLNGPHPSCMVLKQGETLELLDKTSHHLQVVTRHGTPRFIGWGDRASFVETH